MESEDGALRVVVLGSVFGQSRDGYYRIPVAVVNDGANTRYIVAVSKPGAPRYELEKLVDGEWVRAYVPVIEDILLDPIAIRPGDSLRVDPLPSNSRPDVMPAFTIRPITGRYRVRYFYTDTPAATTRRGPDAPDSITSGEFELRE